MRCRRLILVCAALTALMITGCSAQTRATYIPEGGSYTSDSLSSALDGSDPGSISRVAPEDALATRQEVLADLRTHGDEAVRLADVLTSEFPADTTAVPYIVELGDFDGKPAWIVFEAWGDSGEALAHRRVWAFSLDDLSVVAADSVR